MQKILMILICMFIGSAHATEMCAKNDTVVIPLDATVGGSTGAGNAIEWIWWAEFPYGKVYGSVSCLSLQELQKIQYDSSIIPGNVSYVLNNSDDELVGRSGIDSDGNKRKYCVCKLTHPMSSNWVYLNMVEGCGCKCPDYVWSNTTFRTYIFSAIGASMAETE